MLVAWRLVAEHHVGTGHVVLLVVCHGLPHGGLVDNFGAKAGAPTGDIARHRLVVKRFAHTDGEEPYLEVERGNHILPVVVVRGHQDDALPLFVIGIDQLAVDKTIAFEDALGRGIKIMQPFDKQVADVAVIVLLQLQKLGVIAVGERVAKIGTRHLAAIAH